MLSIAALLITLSTVNAATRELWWNITYTTANPDGLFARRVIGVNNTWPPPPIEITSNDTLLLHTLNSLDVPTSLHHHGMFFNRSGWADGAVGVTQCGIPPGSSFTYQIAVQDWNQWGTYWVHAHNKGQYVDGLRAPFVIHNAAGEVHQYDDEYTVILGDWYHNQYDAIAANFLSIKNPAGAEPVPDSAIIYFTHDGSYLSAQNTNSVGFNSNTSLPFTPSKTYRLRIINTSAFSMMYFWIDGHDMRVIEVDGTDIQEYETSLLSITVAQRYSVLVTARNDTSPQNFVIHANMDTAMFESVPPALNPNITSSVVYNEGAQLADAVDVQNYFDLNDTALVPFAPEPPLPSPDRIIDLNVFFATYDDGTNRASFNNITYNSPLVPSLLTEMTMGNNSVVPDVYGPNAFVLEPNQIVEIRVHNWDTGKHPFHLHGHKFQIIHKSADVTSSDPVVNPPESLGPAANPIRRDTVEVPGGGNAFLRMRADNPGAWLFHCHIEWHLTAGLAVTFIEAPLLAQSQIPPTMPDTIAQQCLALGMPAAGNAAGRNSTTDLRGARVGPFPQRLGWRPKGVGAMAGCVAAAAVGMVSVVWYALGGGYRSEEEMEREVREEMEKKKKAGSGGVRGFVRRQ